MTRRLSEAGTEPGTKKGTKTEFGFKLHTLVDKENQSIRRFDTSTTSVHDSQINLSQNGETV